MDLPTTKYAHHWTRASIGHRNGGSNMGSGVNAICECGYECCCPIGGGIESFREVCCFPALCEHCNILLQINLLADELTCPCCGRAQVVPYDDPKLTGVKGSTIVAEWNLSNVTNKLGRHLVLHDGTYQCPACRKFDLRFSDAGLMWDCLLYTSPSPRDRQRSRMPSSA